MKEEIWKDIEGFEGLYQVSSFGKVKSIGRTIYKQDRWGRVQEYYLKEKILSYYINSSGYCVVNLYNGEKCVHKLIHRLVAIAFISNPDNLPEVNHNDENKQNNFYENLSWCDRKFNNNYGKQSKRGRRIASKHRMKRVEQLDINGTSINIYEGIRVAEEETGIDNTAISRCCRGIFKTAGGYVWRYLNE